MPWQFRQLAQEVSGVVLSIRARPTSTQPTRRSRDNNSKRWVCTTQSENTEWIALLSFASQRTTFTDGCTRCIAHGCRVCPRGIYRR